MKLKPITIFAIMMTIVSVSLTSYLFFYKPFVKKISERSCEKTRTLIIEMIARGNQNTDEIRANLSKGTEQICN